MLAKLREDLAKTQQRLHALAITGQHPDFLGEIRALDNELIQEVEQLDRIIGKN